MSVFVLVWKGEEIDEFETRKEAKAMQAEYNMAYGGGVTIKRKRCQLSLTLERG